MVQTSRTFRIFVSSTFSDLKAERNALQERVFPRLRDLCTQHSARFQAIDLRWGVSEEAGLDQQTMDICLGEIERCQKTSPRPNFIVLLGDRYGWRPLPAEIPATEFAEIERRVTDEGSKALLATWYRRDDNAVPPVYVLQPRSGRFVDYAAWETEAERPLRAILQRATDGLPLTPAQRLKYTASATEQEIAQGALGVPDAAEHVFCFFRAIDGLPSDARAQDFLDLDASGNRDAEAEDRQKRLKEHLRRQLPGHVFDYQARWTGNGITTDHLDQLCDDVYQSLARVIQQELAQLAAIDRLDQEVAAHGAFGRDRARHFVGRAALLQALGDYVRGTGHRPLAVCGASGSGKSALLAQAVQQAQGAQPQAEVLVRFIGATPESSNGRALLEGLCREVSRRYGADESTVPADYRELVGEFPQRLALATARQPLVLFLDALDQLSATDSTRNLTWLPAELPVHVRLVVSTAPGECLAALEGKLPATNRVALEPMPPSEGAALLNLWLIEVGRILQPQQRADVLGRFAGCGLPLYLRLAFEEARLWRSYTESTDLSPDIPGVIRDLFARLSAEAHHGAALVSRSLSYLAAARHGLTEDELLDVLSADEAVRTDFRRRSPKSPAVTRLPAVVWSRLYFDLEPYLTERSADGTSLMAFYHRQLGEVVAQDYLAGEENRQRHCALARYFGGQSLQAEELSNLRKLSELPYQQTQGQMWPELVATLTDLEFVDAKCAAGLVYDLIADYNTALAQDELTGAKPLLVSASESARLREFARFVQAQSHVLARFPGLAFQQAANEPSWTVPAEAARRQPAGPGNRPWLHWVNNPGASSNCLMTLLGHASGTAGITDCAFSSDGRRIVSSAEDGVRVWDADTGAELLALTGRWDIVRQCAISPDGQRIVSVAATRTQDWRTEPLLYALALWDAHTGARLATLTEGAGRVTACAFSPDSRRIAAAFYDQGIAVWDALTGAGRLTISMPGEHPVACAFSSDGQRILSASAGQTMPVRVWDAETGRQLSNLALRGQHSPDSMCEAPCAFSPDGTRIVAMEWGYSAREQRIFRGLVVWDVQTGTLLAAYDGHVGVTDNGIRACAFSPDGRRIASAADSRTAAHSLKLWDAATGAELETLTGHTSMVTACAFSSDGQRIVSGSDDGVLKLWNAEWLDGSHLNKIRQEGVLLARAWAAENRRTGLLPADQDRFMAEFRAGQHRTEYAEHTDCIHACAFSPDGRRMVSASEDGTLKHWDPESGAILGTLAGHRDAVAACAFSPDGRRLVSAARATGLKLWDVEARAELSTLVGYEGRVQTCAFSPDGKQIVSGSRDATLIIWDAETGARRAVLSGHEVGITTCAFSPDGRRIASACGMMQGVEGYYDETVRLWDAEAGACLAILAGANVMPCLAFSPDGRRIAAGSGYGSLCLWDTETHAPIKYLDRHATSVTDCAFSPDDRVLVSASFDGTLRLWDAHTGAEVQVLTGHEGPVNACALSPDGQWIVSVSEDGTLRLWDAHTGALVGAYWIGVPAGVVAWSPTGRLVAVGTAKGPVYLLRLENCPPGPTVITAWRGSDGGHAYGCPACRTWHSVPDLDLGSEVACPGCGQVVRLNPFTINADWQPVARAWGTAAEVAPPKPAPPIPPAPATPDTAGDQSDWLQTFASQSPTPDWLREEPAGPPVEPPPPGPTAALEPTTGRMPEILKPHEAGEPDSEIPAWLRGLQALDLPPLPVEPTPPDGWPDWLSGLQSEPSTPEQSGPPVQAPAGAVFQNQAAARTEQKIRAAELRWLAASLRTRGDLRGALELLAEQTQIYCDLEDVESLQSVLQERYSILKKLQDTEQELELHREAERLSRQLGAQSLLAAALGNQALICQGRGELERAMELYHREERICREIGDRAGLGRTLWNQGLLLLEDRHDLRGAQPLFQEQEQLCRELDDLESLKHSLDRQVEILKGLGDVEGELNLHRHTEQFFREIGEPALAAYALGSQADILTRRGELTRALELLQKQE